MTTPDRVVHFHRKHHDAVVSGAKLSTVRWNENVCEGPATFVFDDHPTAEPVAGRVIQVETYPVGQLSASAARQPPGTDMTVFVDELRANYYPDMPDDALLQVVVITVTPQRGFQRSDSGPQHPVDPDRPVPSVRN